MRYSMARRALMALLIAFPLIVAADALAGQKDFTKGQKLYRTGKNKTNIHIIQESSQHIEVVVGYITAFDDRKNTIVMDGETFKVGGVTVYDRYYVELTKYYLTPPAQVRLVYEYGKLKHVVVLSDVMHPGTTPQGPGK